MGGVWFWLLKPSFASVNIFIIFMTLIYNLQYGHMHAGLVYVTSCELLLRAEGPCDLLFSTNFIFWIDTGFHNLSSLIRVCVFTDQLRKNIYLHIVWIRSQVSYSEHDTLSRLGLPKSLFHRDFFNVLVLN